VANRHRSTRGSRPRYQWIRESTDLNEVVDGATLGLMEITDAEILAEALASPTLVRVRGEIFIQVTPTTAGVSETTALGVGIIVVPSTVTAAEVSGPLAAPNLEWMYWTARRLTAPDVAPVSVAPGFFRWDVDVKAMRKIHKSSVHLIVENSGDATMSIFASAALSFLFQE